MKASELRIGNYFLDGEDKLCKTHSINHNYIICWINKHIGSLDIKYVKPIPLTEEWLIKFGFRKDKEYER